MPCGGSAELADGISSVASSVVDPWGTMADGMSCIGGLTACSVASTGWLADVGGRCGDWHGLLSFLLCLSIC
jgi:hypothetical protein